MLKISFTIQGMHCNACKALIEDVCREDGPGVVFCTVDFLSGKAQIEHNGGLDRESLKKKIESLGDYRVVLNLKQTNA